MGCSDSPRSTSTALRTLSLADSRIGQELRVFNRSARIARDNLDAAITTHNQLREDWNAFGRRMDNYNAILARHRRIVDSFMRNTPLIDANEIADPLQVIDNIEDLEHADYMVLVFSWR